MTVPIEKEVTRTDKNGEETTKNISYILQFIDSTRFMVGSISILVNNLSEGIHKMKCKYRHDDKKFETCGMTHATVFLNTQTLNTIQNNINVFCKFISLLRKGVYPYEYMDDWEKLNETSFSETKIFIVI